MYVIIIAAGGRNAAGYALAADKVILQGRTYSERSKVSCNVLTPGSNSVSYRIMCQRNVLLNNAPYVIGRREPALIRQNKLTACSVCDVLR